MMHAREMKQLKIQTKKMLMAELTMNFAMKVRCQLGIFYESDVLDDMMMLQ